MAVRDYCIDSDILIDYLRGFPESRDFFLNASNGRTLFVSAVNVVEIYSGKDTKEKLKRENIGEFLSNFKIIPLHETVAKRAGMLRRDYGKPFADTIIAATAIEYNLTLVTRNEKHFRGIAELKIFVPY